MIVSASQAADGFGAVMSVGGLWLSGRTYFRSSVTSCPASAPVHVSACAHVRERNTLICQFGPVDLIVTVKRSKISCRLSCIIDKVPAFHIGDKQRELEFPLDSLQ